MPSPNWPRQKTYSPTLDEKGRVVVHSLEYTIIYQCVNRCRACNHFTYLQPKHEISTADFQRDVEKMASISHCDKFSLIGGECLLHPNLLELLDIAKAYGIGDVVSLTTNGQLLDRYGKEFWSRLDRIEMGIYAGKWDVESFGALLDTIQDWSIPAFLGMVGSHDPILLRMVQDHCKLNPKLWQTCSNSSFHPTLSSDYADEPEAQRRFTRCLYGHVCNTLDQGYVYRCPEACFIPTLYPTSIEKADRLVIQDLTAASFLDLVRAEEHLGTCHLCRSLECYFPWQEVPEGTTPEEWIRLAKESE